VEHLNGAPLGYVLVLPTNIRLGIRDLPRKNSSLLRKSVNYSRKKFNSTGPCIIKHFTAIINFVIQFTCAFSIVRHFLLTLINTLAFHVTELITAVISFIIQAPAYSNRVQMPTKKFYIAGPRKLKLR
jgi:hypothetical protein